MELREAIRRNPMSGFQWTVVVICIMLTVIDGYEILVTAFTLPALTKAWGLTLGQQGLVASIGTLGMGSARPCSRRWPTGSVAAGTSSSR